MEKERKHFLQIATDQAVNQAKLYLENERTQNAELKLKKKELKRKEQPPNWVKSINEKLDKLDTKRPKQTTIPATPSPSPSPSPPAPKAPPKIYSQMFPGRQNV